MTSVGAALRAGVLLAAVATLAPLAALSGTPSPLLPLDAFPRQSLDRLVRIGL